MPWSHQKPLPPQLPWKRHWDESHETCCPAPRFPPSFLCLVPTATVTVQVWSASQSFQICFFQIVAVTVSDALADERPDPHQPAPCHPVVDGLWRTQKEGQDAQHQYTCPGVHKLDCVRAPAHFPAVLLEHSTILWTGTRRSSGSRCKVPDPQVREKEEEPL